MDFLLSLDYRVMLWLHSLDTPTWFDGWMIFCRNRFFWAPLYFFVLVWIFTHGNRNRILILVWVLVAVALTDFISASMIKPWLSRIRPCHQEALEGYLHVLVSCGSGYSFPSAHAANHMGMAVIFRSLFQTTWGRWSWIWLIWALLVGFAQVFVGVHYPLDILGGGILGFLVGHLLCRYGEKHIWTDFIKLPTTS